mmetsp:Transcript_18086/g.54359  ORF Transcript_18086/g.54359 Transcript_18086/m.54359 type:complete len:346 (+) Transcript_18086:402-1439(+)
MQQYPGGGAPAHPHQQTLPSLGSAALFPPPHVSGDVMNSLSHIQQQQQQQHQRYLQEQQLQQQQEQMVQCLHEIQQLAMQYSLATLAHKKNHGKRDYQAIMSFLSTMRERGLHYFFGFGDGRYHTSVISFQQCWRSAGDWCFVVSEETELKRMLDHVSGVVASTQKKYYWVAGAKRRYLKRELSSLSKPVSLHYIIQKTSKDLSRRCVCLPGTNQWLVLWVPASVASTASSSSASSPASVTASPAHFSGAVSVSASAPVMHAPHQSHDPTYALLPQLAPPHAQTSAYPRRPSAGDIFFSYSAGPPTATATATNTSNQATVPTAAPPPPPTNKWIRSFRCLHTSCW